MSRSLVRPRNLDRELRVSEGVLHGREAMDVERGRRLNPIERGFGALRVPLLERGPRHGRERSISRPRRLRHRNGPRSRRRRRRPIGGGELGPRCRQMAQRLGVTLVPLPPPPDNGREEPAHAQQRQSDGAESADTGAGRHERRQSRSIAPRGADTASIVRVRGFMGTSSVVDGHDRWGCDESERFTLRRSAVGHLGSNATGGCTSIRPSQHKHGRWSVLPAHRGPEPSLEQQGACAHIPYRAKAKPRKDESGKRSRSRLLARWIEPAYSAYGGPWGNEPASGLQNPDGSPRISRGKPRRSRRERTERRQGTRHSVETGGKVGAVVLGGIEWWTSSRGHTRFRAGSPCCKSRRHAAKSMWRSPRPRPAWIFSGEFPSMTMTLRAP